MIRRVHPARLHALDEHVVTLLPLAALDDLADLRHQHVHRARTVVPPPSSFGRM
jgi:hypothetical protein